MAVLDAPRVTVVLKLCMLCWQVQEQKGLDMVRRDWCPLSKDVGNFALREILSAKPKEEVVAAIHDHLHKVCFQNLLVLLCAQSLSCSAGAGEHTRRQKYHRD